MISTFRHGGNAPIVGELIAGLLITTEAMVAELPKKESGNAGWWRHEWNGRNGLLIAPFILENNKAREFPGPFSCAAAKVGHPMTRADRPGAETNARVHAAAHSIS